MFSSASDSAPPSAPEETEAGSEAASAPAPAGEDAAADAGGESTNLADQAGAGEENEETVIEQRGKLFLFEDGSNVTKGLGQFKVKRAKEAEGGKKKRRLLMRTQGSGFLLLVRNDATVGMGGMELMR